MNMAKRRILQYDEWEITKNGFKNSVIPPACHQERYVQQCIRCIIDWSVVGEVFLLNVLLNFVRSKEVKKN